jgi:hypothetical protein
MDREALAWAAGLFDGEGGFFYTTFRRKSGRLDRSISTRVTQADPEVLERFRRCVRLGKVYGPYDRSKYRQQPQWQYVVYDFQATQAIAAMLWPWLGTIKRRQAAAVLQQARENPQGRMGRPPRNPALLRLGAGPP